MVTNAEAFSELATADVAGRAPALVQLGRSLADAVDRDSATSCDACKRSGANAALWREYRQVVNDVVALMAQENDGQAEILALVRTPVGNAKKSGARNVRAADRKDGGAAETAVDAVAAAGSGRRRRTP